MIAETCAGCRFWLAVSDASDCPVDGAAFGWCRREPPKIIDRMARIAIRTPGFGGNVVDPEDVAGASTVHSTSLHPATYRTHWCGRYQAHPMEER